MRLFCHVTTVMKSQAILSPVPDVLMYIPYELSSYYPQHITPRHLKCSAQKYCPNAVVVG